MLLQFYQIEFFSFIYYLNNIIWGISVILALSLPFILAYQIHLSNITKD